MLSKIAAAVGLKTHPVALIWSDRAPDNAIQFKPGRWGCVVNLIATVAARGKTGVFDRNTYGCFGGGVGLGFGNCYKDFPGGMEGFCRFLSSGNAETDQGRAAAAAMAQTPGFARMASDFLHGERYLKDPATVDRFMQALPMRDVPARYVVFKPLEDVDPMREKVNSITFFVEPDALAALVVLANYTHPERENVGFPFAAGCQVIGILSYREYESATPRALVGLSDLSARRQVRPILGSNVFSFTAPWSVFFAMENCVEGSFFGRETWQDLMKAD